MSELCFNCEESIGLLDAKIKITVQGESREEVFKCCRACAIDLLKEMQEQKRRLTRLAKKYEIVAADQAADFDYGGAA